MLFVLLTFLPFPSFPPSIPYSFISHLIIHIHSLLQTVINFHLPTDLFIYLSTFLFICQLLFTQSTASHPHILVCFHFTHSLSFFLTNSRFTPPLLPSVPGLHPSLLCSGVMEPCCWWIGFLSRPGTESFVKANKLQSVTRGRLIAWWTESSEPYHNLTRRRSQSISHTLRSHIRSLYNSHRAPPWPARSITQSQCC